MGIFISSFTYCDSIETQMTPNGPAFQIVKPLQILAPIAIPGNYSFAISCSLSDISSSEGKTMTIVFSDPDGNEVAKVGNIRIEIPKEASNSKVASMQVNIDFRNLIISKEGVYKTSVILENDTIGEYRIPVFKGELK